ncbi:MAG: sigma-E processing peptidase SpoIIGA [Clostridia bacterium]|nr:sigma-E processing peptidase SpoIIGA [Clostridia bacterium]
MTGRCVCLVEWDSLRELFDGCGSVEDIISHIEEIQLFAVPYRTVGVQSGIIYSFLPDCLELTAESRIIENTLIGIYDGKLSKRNEYNALMNAEMM